MAGENERRTSNVSCFMDAMKEGNIVSNKASISVHKDMLIQNLMQAVGNRQDGQSLFLKKRLDLLNGIKEDNMGLNIIDPLIGISTQLEVIFDTLSETEKLWVVEQKEAFKRGLYNLLSIAQHTKDKRITDHTFAAADSFLEKFTEKTA